MARCVRCRRRSAPNGGTTTWPFGRCSSGCEPAATTAATARPRPTVGVPHGIRRATRRTAPSSQSLGFHAKPKARRPRPSTTTTGAAVGSPATRPNTKTGTSTPSSPRPSQGVEQRPSTRKASTVTFTTSGLFYLTFRDILQNDTAIDLRGRHDQGGAVHEQLDDAEFRHEHRVCGGAVQRERGRHPVGRHRSRRRRFHGPAGTLKYDADDTAWGPRRSRTRSGCLVCTTTRSRHRSTNPAIVAVTFGAGLLGHVGGAHDRLGCGRDLHYRPDPLTCRSPGTRRLAPASSPGCSALSPSPARSSAPTTAPPTTPHGRKLSPSAKPTCGSDVHIADRVLPTGSTTAYSGITSRRSASSSTATTTPPARGRRTARQVNILGSGFSSEHRAAVLVLRPGPVPTPAI